MDNISKLTDCYGCGVCVAACPVKIISLREDKEGFYKPVIDETEKCINCGLCLKVCGYNHREIADSTEAVTAYAGWSNDELTRQWCSSGGIGFELGRHLIAKGYKGVGVRYNVPENRAEHYIAATVEDFMPSVGSKYIPSYTSDAFLNISRKEKYLVTGTPCQIDSFRRYIRHFRVEDNFVLMDFFCHGVPSLKMWDEYTRELKDKIGEISFVSWRNKTTGWHDSWSMNADPAQQPQSIDWHDSYNLKVKGKKHLWQSRLSEGDLFYKFFLGHYCLNKCCHDSCKYKKCNSAADIRIGDLWGKTYRNDSKGTSAVLAFTPKGRTVLEEMGTAITLIPHDTSIVTEGQMAKCASKPWIRPFVIRALDNHQSLSHIQSTLGRLYAISILPKRVINKICRLLHRS